jgi:glyoxylase-like metal-dependent hydrolase (beta-lactamase superfamily II)
MMKQEQEKAREEVTEVAPGVLRMQLDIQIPGLGHVNCYALLDNEGAAVVDPGLPGPDTYKILVSRLKQADLKIKDIHSVIVTHSHPDHFGGAARIAAESGAKVIAHENFSFGPAAAHHHHEPEVSVEDLEAHRSALEGDQASHEPKPGKAQISSYAPATEGHRSKGTPWGGSSPRPPKKMFFKWMMMRWLGKANWFPEISDPVKGGDVLRLAGREWFVVHTPGHTEDHFCLHDPASQLFIAGDHVLPTITPHISGITQRPDPLNAFFESLDRVAELPDVANVLPAHGHPFDDLANRADAIKKHHFERLDKLRSIGKELGPSTVTAFSHELFREKSWGAMAESETYAHLEHLRLAGDADVHEEARKLIYSTG